MENTQELPLTSAQRNLWAHLQARRARGLAPATLDELCEELGLASRGSLHKQVVALIGHGLVEPMDGKQRGVRLCATPQPVPEPMHTLPLLGRIAAGRPIDAIAADEQIAVPSQLMPRGSGYALRVQGESMRDVGIVDGDVVIIEAREHARSGEVVVALVDGEAATLKRLRLRGEWTELESENADFPVQRYAAERVQVQGVVVGLLRSYK
jgi:repressor LexA